MPSSPSCECICAKQIYWYYIYIEIRRANELRQGLNGPESWPRLLSALEPPDESFESLIEIPFYGPPAVLGRGGGGGMCIASVNDIWPAAECHAILVTHLTGVHCARVCVCACVLLHNTSTVSNGVMCRCTVRSVHTTHILTQLSQEAQEKAALSKSYIHLRCDVTAVLQRCPT